MAGFDLENATIDAQSKIKKSQSLAALASYFRSPVAVADASLDFLPLAPPIPWADNRAEGCD